MEVEPIYLRRDVRTWWWSGFIYGATCMGIVMSVMWLLLLEGYK